MEKITIVCQDGKEVKLKRSLIPRMGPMLIQAFQQKSTAKFEELDQDSLVKIVSWLEHYKENPMRTQGQFSPSEWDETFFKDVDATRFVDMGCTADDFFKVDGFFDYIMTYLKFQYDKLELPQKILLKLAYSKEQNEVSLFALMECLLMKK